MPPQDTSVTSVRPVVGANRTAGFETAADALNQVLRLWCCQRGLRTTVFRRLGHARPLAHRWSGTPDFASLAQKIASQKLERARPAAGQAPPRWLKERSHDLSTVPRHPPVPIGVPTLAAEGGRIATDCARENSICPTANARKFCKSKISYYPN